MAHFHPKFTRCDLGTIFFYTAPMDNKTTSAVTEYRAFLLRFSKEPTQTDWRIAVRDIQADQMTHCLTLAELVAFLADEMMDHAKRDHDKSEKDGQL